MATTFVFQHDGAFERIVRELRAEVDDGDVLFALHGGAYAFGTQWYHQRITLVHL